jgi:hypothetical protein
MAVESILSLTEVGFVDPAGTRLEPVLGIEA